MYNVPVYLPVYHGLPKLCNHLPKWCNGFPKLCNDLSKLCNDLPKLCNGFQTLCNDLPKLCNGFPKVCNNSSILCKPLLGCIIFFFNVNHVLICLRIVFAPQLCNNTLK